MLKAAVFVLIWLISSHAWAQETLYLIRVVQGDSEQPVHVWWQGNAAAFSEDDKTLISAAREQNLNVLQPGDLSQISRILRQPVLTDANAANLARLLGAEIAVFGVIELSGPTHLSVLPLYGFRAELRAKTMKFSGNDVVTEDLEIVQHAYSQRFEDSRKGALEELGRRLALGLRHSKVSTSGPVGVETTFPTLKFDGLQTARALDLISTFLMDLNQVQDVEVVWVGRGQVALKVVDKLRKSLERSEVEQIGRSLVNAQFDGFRLSMSTEQASPNTLEFKLVPSITQP